MDKKRWKEFISVCILMMSVQIVRYLPTVKFGGWNQIQLSFSYAYGFIQRAFVGTILDVMSNVFHIPLRYMRYIHEIGSLFLFTLLLAIVAIGAINQVKSDPDKVNLFIGITFLFLLGPGWTTFFCNLGLTDIWLPMVTIISLIALLKERKIWLALLMSCIGILIHPMYIFMYFNCIFVFLFYKVLVVKENRKWVIYTIFVTVIDCTLALYMLFFAHVKNGVSVEQIMNRSAEFVNKPLDAIQQHEITVRSYLFREKTIPLHFEGKDYWLIFIVMILVFMPFLIEILRYWKYIAVEAKNKGFKFFYCYYLVPFGVITLVPMYIMVCDYGRWTYAGFFYEIAMIMIFNLCADEYVTLATKKYMERIKSNKWYYLFLVVFCCILGAFEQNLINPIIAGLEQLAWKFLDMIWH